MSGLRATSDDYYESRSEKYVLAKSRMGKGENDKGEGSTSLRLGRIEPRVYYRVSPRA